MQHVLALFSAMYAIFFHCITDTLSFQIIYLFFNKAIHMLAFKQDISARVCHSYLHEKLIICFSATRITLTQETFAKKFFELLLFFMSRLVVSFCGVRSDNTST